MAYEKQTWQTGDVITSAKLNHMEDGIANIGDTLVISGFSRDENTGDVVGTSNKTWQEIHDALVNGKRCVIVIPDVYDAEQLLVTSATVDPIEGVYSINTEAFSPEADSTNEYPTTGGK